MLPSLIVSLGIHLAQAPWAGLRLLSPQAAFQDPSQALPWEGEHLALVHRAGRPGPAYAIRRVTIRFTQDRDPQSGEATLTPVCGLEDSEEVLLFLEGAPAPARITHASPLSRRSDAFQDGCSGTFRGRRFEFHQVRRDRTHRPLHHLTLRTGKASISFRADETFGLDASVLWVGDLDGDGRIDFLLEWDSETDLPPIRCLYLSSMGRNGRPFGVIPADGSAPARIAPEKRRRRPPRRSPPSSAPRGKMGD